MTRFHRLQFSLALVATAGMLMPPAAWAQEDVNGSPTAPETNEAPASDIIDVAMSTDGRFEGVLVDEQGNPIEAAAITMYRGDEVAAELTTGADGRFSSTGLEAGVYRIASAQGESIFRLWSHEAAPPTAISSAVLVSSSDVARAQFGLLDPVNTSLILLGVGSVVLSAITLGEVDQTQDEIDDLEDLISP